MDNVLRQVKIEIKPSQSFNTMIALVISMGLAAWLGLKVQSWVGFPIKGVFPVLGIIGVFISWLKQSTAEYISKFEDRAEIAEKTAREAERDREDAELLLKSWHAKIQKLQSLEGENQSMSIELQSAKKDLQLMRAKRQSLEKELATANQKLATAEKNLSSAKQEISECVKTLEQSGEQMAKQVKQQVDNYKRSVAPYLDLHKHTQAYFGLWSVTNNRNASQEARSLASADKEQARTHIDNILKKASPVGFEFDPDDYQVKLTPIY